MITTTMTGFEAGKEYEEEYDYVLQKVLVEDILKIWNKVRREWIRTRSPVKFSKPFIVETPKGNTFYLGPKISKAKHFEQSMIKTCVYLILLDPGSGKKMVYYFPPKLRDNEEFCRQIKENGGLTHKGLPMKITLHFLQRYLERYWEEDPKSYTFEEMAWKFLYRNEIFTFFPPSLEEMTMPIYDSFGCCNDGVILSRENNTTGIRSFNTFITRDMLFSSQVGAMEEAGMDEKIAECRKVISQMTGF